MATEVVVRDSCILYEELGYEQIDRLINGQIANQLAQQKIGVKVCPICKVEHCNEKEVCSLCEPDYNY